ncbi:MAG: hypothetical protein ACI9HK_001314 [Pirellulaceae bacterium]|jgi:hypothetical protein
MLSRICHIVLLSFAFGLLNALHALAESRTWTDKSGTRKFHAELVDFDGTASLQHSGQPIRYSFKHTRPTAKPAAPSTVRFFRFNLTGE